MKVTDPLRNVAPHRSKTEANNAPSAAAQRSSSHLRPRGSYRTSCLKPSWPMSCSTHLEAAGRQQHSRTERTTSWGFRKENKSVVSIVLVCLIYFGSLWFAFDVGPVHQTALDPTVFPPSRMSRGSESTSLAPNLRLLTLRLPCGTDRQLLYLL
jgi:hypothetical protein